MRPEITIKGVTSVSLPDLIKANYKCDRPLMDKCQSCLQQMNEKLQMPRMPEYLILRLNRYNESSINKLKYKVQLDIQLGKVDLHDGNKYEILSIVTSDKTDQIDDIYCVYNRNIATNEWYCYCNSLVYKVTYEEIMASDRGNYLVYKKC